MANVTNITNSVKKLSLYDSEYIRYTVEDQEYITLIHQDESADNPREAWGEDMNLAHLYCWHRHYSLGDKHDYADPEEFLYDLAERHIGMDKIRRMVESGETNIEVAQSDEMFLLIEHTSGEQYIIAEEESKEALFSEANRRDILEAFNFSLLSLLQTCDDIVILPLYLMDHSGLSISVEDFGDRWDSGQVGWAYVSRDEFLKKSGCPEKDWQENATANIKAQVNTYDQFLTDDVYWFETFARDEDGNWESVDSCSGFYGSDILENGVVENVDGLYDAIQSGQYTTGTAKMKKIVTTIWEFD